VARSSGGSHGCALLKDIELWGGGRCCAVVVEVGLFTLRPGSE
jgi:hypothetical protein